MSKNIQKVKKMEKQQRFLSENMIDAIWIVDVETLSFDYMTSSIKKISGFSADDYLTKKVQDRVTSKGFVEIAVLLEKEIPKFEKGIKKVVTLETQLIHKNKTNYWAHIKARLFREEDGKLKIMGVTRDITKRKEDEIQQNKLIQKLEKALEEKEKLLKENRDLRSLLPICSSCKRIRDERNKWWPLEAYVGKVIQASLTHTICDDCEDALYGDEDWYKAKKDREK